MDIALYQSLTRAGVSDDHARTTTEAIRSEINRQAASHMAGLATREDLAQLSQKVEADIHGVRLDMAGLRLEFKTDLSAVKDDIQQLRSDVVDRMETLHRWTLGTSLAVTSLVVTSLVAAARAWPA